MQQMQSCPFRGILPPSKKEKKKKDSHMGEMGQSERKMIFKHVLVSLVTHIFTESQLVFDA